MSPPNEQNGRPTGHQLNTSDNYGRNSSAHHGDENYELTNGNDNRVEHSTRNIINHGFMVLHQPRRHPRFLTAVILVAVIICVAIIVPIVVTEVNHDQAQDVPRSSSTTSNIDILGRFKFVNFDHIHDSRSDMYRNSNKYHDLHVRNSSSPMQLGLPRRLLPKR
ncbi:uncharacterized protein Z520_03274 [Fonsecaea multimorphosa CBS 102226]|uniref:Transmembrane protein n=1 Tax=Fonsecaea multimorphosa CBS 102226 TaxID=1442371 RepID=A0A0D2HFA2_9EURO|nr:uncharacterized protein Z520_03274 [Fonsecaea multimorphosa CBS 102226]KIY00611.1 hypothetical protein Z520_03274 [Fonsecaea multimorphosa CBS 102226]OAL19002.1 hypothetical protein AYO22_10331 [Fonsecaea multimorphosa]